MLNNNVLIVDIFWKCLNCKCIFVPQIGKGRLKLFKSKLCCRVIVNSFKKQMSPKYHLNKLYFLFLVA